MLACVYNEFTADSRVSFALRANYQGGLVRVYVYDNVLWIPWKGLFQKFEEFDYMLNFRELDSLESVVPCATRYV